MLPAALYHRKLYLTKEQLIDMRPWFVAMFVQATLARRQLAQPARRQARPAILARRQARLAILARQQAQLVLRLAQPAILAQQRAQLAQRLAALAQRRQPATPARQRQPKSNWTWLKKPWGSNKAQLSELCAAKMSNSKKLKQSCLPIWLNATHLSRNSRLIKPILKKSSSFARA
jgi:hypothetical protein